MPMKRLCAVMLSIFLSIGCIFGASPTSIIVNAASEKYTVDTVPLFSDKPYVEINGNVPYFTQTEITTEVFETYSELDSLGRCGVAYANVCREIMPAESRGPIGMIKPSGWHTVKYDFVDGKYLYNRCHLIGYQLAGENANERNLITGTRYLNVTGMLPFEDQVAYYAENTGNHVLYRATPVFEGNNLVASGVLLEAYSVEDKGRGVCFCVFCYNAQPGVTINYATGDSSLSKVIAMSSPGKYQIYTNAPEDTDTVRSSDKAEYSYVLNKNTKKFHKTNCSSVSDMKEKNKEYFSGTRQEAIDKGYTPCKRCNP